MTPGAGASETASNTSDTYQQGLLATETNATTNTLLATFTYDSNGTPVSVLVGSDPTTAPRYYYVFDGHGNVVALTDASGNAVATYAYDEFGNVTIDTEHFSSGWHNPYLYDGAERVRYDSTTGLDWMSVRAYDPTLGRFISRDPLGRSPLFGLASQPYVYTDNNPLSRTDPSGQLMHSSSGHYFAPPRRQKGRGAPAPATKSRTGAKRTTKTATTTTTAKKCDTVCKAQNAININGGARTFFLGYGTLVLGVAGAILYLGATLASAIAGAIAAASDSLFGALLVPVLTDLEEQALQVVVMGGLGVIAGMAILAIGTMFTIAGFHGPKSGFWTESNLEGMRSTAQAILGAAAFAFKSFALFLRGAMAALFSLTSIPALAFLTPLVSQVWGWAAGFAGDFALLGYASEQLNFYVGEEENALT